MHTFILLVTNYNANNKIQFFFAKYCKNAFKMRTETCNANVIKSNGLINYYLLIW